MSAMFQALAQCENTLTKLGVVREAVDDTAGAAQVSDDAVLFDTWFWLNPPHWSSLMEAEFSKCPFFL